MSYAGYATSVMMTGTSTAMTDDPMKLVSGKTYKIVATAKRVWDRTQTITVKDNTVAVSASNILSIDYLFGQVTFVSGYTVSGAITVSGKYLPMAAVAGSHAYTLNTARELLDDTDHTSTGFHSRTAGLLDASVSVTRWHSIADTGFHDIINTGTPVVVEVRPGGLTSDVARGFFIAESDAMSGDVSALEASELSFQLDGNSAADFGWGTHTT